MLRVSPWNQTGFAMKKYAQMGLYKESFTVTTRFCQNKAKSLESTMH